MNAAPLIEVAALEKERQARVQRALRHIERAQTELNDACSELSGFLDGIPEWNRAGKLADFAKALWQKVNSKRDIYRLDDISIEAAAKKRRSQ